MNKWFIGILILFLFSLFPNVNAIWVKDTDGFNAPSYATGIAFDEGFFDYIWISDPSARTIYHYYDGTTTSGSFSTPSYVADIQGITINETHIFAVSAFYNYLYVFDKNGSLTYKKSLFSSGNSIDFKGITTNGTDFWIVANNAFVYHFNSTWHNQSDGFDISFAGATSPEGITIKDNSFWIVDIDDNYVYHFDSSGNNLSGGFDIGPLGINSSRGITTNGSDFWILDREFEVLPPGNQNCTIEYINETNVTVCKPFPYDNAYVYHLYESASSPPPPESTPEENSTEIICPENYILIDDICMPIFQVPIMEENNTEMNESEEIEPELPRKKHKKRKKKVTIEVIIDNPLNITEEVIIPKKVAKKFIKINNTEVEENFFIKWKFDTF